MPFWLKFIAVLFYYTLQLSDVPDNVQLQKDSDINLMEVLESLAPVPSEEVVAIRPKGEGIERFRRRVEPVSGVSSLPDLPAPQENNSIFSQRPFSDSGATPPSGEGEWDSGHAASSKTKKSEITGEDASGSGEESEVVEQENPKPVEQDEPVVLKPTNSAAASTSNSEEEGSSEAPSTVAADTSENFTSEPQPPPVAISHNAENKPTSAAVAGAASFNAAEPEEAYSAQQVSFANKTTLDQAKNADKESAALPVPTEEGQQTGSNNDHTPESSGLAEGAHPVPSADADQEQAASGSGEANGSGLNADELAFIAGLKKAKEQQRTVPQMPKRTKLPGSVGNDEDDSDDDNNDQESGDASGEQLDSSASGDQEDETTSSGSDETQVADGHRRSESSQMSKEDDSEEDDDVSADGSGSASGEDDEYDDDDDEDGSGESSADETERRDAIVDVASGSGVSFLSGVGQSDSDGGSSESSGEDDEPDDALPGSIGEVNDIANLEKKPAEPLTAPGFAFSSGSGEAVPGNVKNVATSGSGLPDVAKGQDSVVKPVQDRTPPKPSALSPASGEAELPGSVGGIADIGQLESDARADADTDASGSGKSTPRLINSNSQFNTEESLLQQVLPSASSGSGESEKQEESLPGSIGGHINIHEARDSSNSGSGEEVVKIVSPASSIGSGESPRSRSHVADVPFVLESDSSGSGSDEQLSGSGIGDDLQSLASSSEDETLPGSVGAVGPNLMTMASPENKAGSGMADQSGSGSEAGSGLKEEGNLMNTFQFADSSGSGSGQVEKDESAVKDSIETTKVSQPLAAFADKNDASQSGNSTITAQTKPASEKAEKSSDEFGLLKSLQPSQGSGVAEEPLPGGFGNGDSADIQSLAGSGGEDASGFTFQSGLGSFLDGTSASGSADLDVVSDVSGRSSSGSGKFSSDSNDFESVSKKDFAPTASASASASAEQDSGSSSGSASKPLKIVKHTYLPTPKKVGTGISSTTLAASASGYSSSGQSDSGASALPGSVGIEESFSSSGSAIFDTSASGVIPNIADFPQEDLLNTEDVETSASGSEEVSVVESGAGEGSGAQSSGDEGLEETTVRSHTSKVKPVSFNFDSGLQADIVPANFGKIPINLGVGSGSSYGLGSGAGIDYGSAADFLSGSAGSGTLELTPATNPSDAIVNLFGSTLSPAEKEVDSGSSSSAAPSDEGSTVKYVKPGKNRHQIPISGDDEIAPLEDKEQVNIYSFLPPF